MTTSSLAKTYTNVNVNRPAEYWDYDNLVIDWGWVCLCTRVYCPCLFRPVTYRFVSNRIHSPISSPRLAIRMTSSRLFSLPLPRLASLNIASPHLG
jgi:hypothetical protein